jgi:membrane protein required for colicin V production
MGLGLTQFDLIVLGLLAISAALGFFRGAVLEIVSSVALIAGGAAAIFGLPVTAPIAHKLIHLSWLATTAALVVVFVVVFGLLRSIGGAIAHQVRQTRFLGTLDRSVGLAIGLARGLVVLGALNLLFNATTPRDLQPHWIVEATTWPLAQDLGELELKLAPKGANLAGRINPALDRALNGVSRDTIDDRLKSEGYDARQRSEIEDLVEKSR